MVKSNKDLGLSLRGKYWLRIYLNEANLKNMIKPVNKTNKKIKILWCDVEVLNNKRVVSKQQFFSMLQNIGQFFLTFSELNNITVIKLIDNLNNICNQL